MLKQLWRWLKRSFQRLFSNKQTPPLEKPRKVEPPKQLTDAEYESLFLKLLAEVNDGLSRGGAKGFLAAKRINEAHLVEWLRGFGERLLALPTRNDELATRMVRLGELSIGEVSVVAYDIGRRLGKGETNHRGPKDAEEEAQAWFNQGYKQLIVGDFVGAIASYDRFIKIKPHYDEAWNNRGVALKKLRRFEEAIASYNRAIEIKPDDDSAWYNRGVALKNLGRFEEAIASYDRAIEIKPHYNSAWNNRGMALDNLGRFEEAIASYDRAIEIKPHYDEAWNNRGMALNNLGRFKEAIASYDRAIEIKPDYNSAWNNRGVALSKLGLFEEAITSYDKALKIKPDFYQTWYNWGNALFSLRQYEEAITYYEKVLDIKPDLHLGWIARGNATGERMINLFNAEAPNHAQKFNNPNLNKPGYEGKLANYEEGLKHCPQDTHPQYWGELHQVIGKAHYLRGRDDSRYLHHHSFWDKAIDSYNTALQTLTATNFPELHLEVLQNLIHVQLDLKETAEVTELQRQGTDLLRRLLNEPNRSDKNKKQLAFKLAWFQQLTVDLAVQSGDLQQAIELAEEGKNTCLSWLLDGWSHESSSPNYSEIQQLLNPSTAIIYWHLSSYALHTFILKHNAPLPIVLVETEFVTQAQRLQDFESWVKNWNEQYADYRDKAKDEQSPKNKPWRQLMPDKLEELKNILNISAIQEELNGITNLILIPHRDLHRLPLHAIFTDNFIITYLPSAQIGITLQSLKQTNLRAIGELPLLSVEHPDSEGFSILPHAEIESAAITQLFQNPTPKRIAGEAATNTTVKAALKDSYSIFNFTGHSTYNFDNPKKSALALSRKEFLTLEEICNIESLRRYQLVSLSSCETAITSNQTITAEYVGLVSAFLYQGVTDVVSTLWTVTDDASCFLMIYFYWQIKKSKSPAVALNKATKWLRSLTFSQLERIYRVILPKLPSNETTLRPFIRRKLNQISQMELSEKKQQRFQHPYYWAAFTITGG
ncbi:MAG: tetratricopeptide repeat protein [Nostoc sp. ChiQUE02]|uniref:CHAT domain-containing protein n=1 Tax=Nostoc sp. ChiQUE02 TaxID=3075377 RepID=UPI002AD471AC|nr:tetratricopeptide repeat protein [Nostoc sp. ChiQUE02]MDZ8229367.1 tetratricopeptide repeat protein [Nostoc sp. ChiQUE02]